MDPDLGSLFAGEQHRPFSFEAGDTAVVLIHGFPGTPAEMRGLGQRLQAAGISASGPLLPGFGAEFDQLFEMRTEDWVRAVTHHVTARKATHRDVFLFGYSFGGAVALHAAARTQPSGLLLAAPFWRIGGARERWIWRLTRWLFPRFRPFRNLDFSNPDVRSGIEKMMPEIDTREPAIQKQLRGMQVPSSFVDEVMELGAGAKHIAAELGLPVQIFQGSKDQVIAPERTRELAAAFPGPPAYRELPAGHELLMPGTGVLDPIAEETCQFVWAHTSRKTMESR